MTVSVPLISRKPRTSPPSLPVALFIVAAAFGASAVVSEAYPAACALSVWLSYLAARTRKFRPGTHRPFFVFFCGREPLEFTGEDIDGLLNPTFGLTVLRAIVFIIEVVILMIAMTTLARRGELASFSVEPVVLAMHLIVSGVGALGVFNLAYKRRATTIFAKRRAKRSIAGVIRP